MVNMYHNITSVFNCSGQINNAVVKTLIVLHKLALLCTIYSHVSQQCGFLQDLCTHTETEKRIMYRSYL